MTARLEAAAAAVDAAAELTTAAAEHLARGAAEGGRISVAKLDRHQVLAYDLAHAASGLEGCRVMLDYGAHGELEGMLADHAPGDARRKRLRLFDGLLSHLFHS